MGDDRFLHRCRDPLAGDFCAEVELRLEAAAEMIAEGCQTHGEELFSIAARIVLVHEQENELREGRR